MKLYSKQSLLKALKDAGLPSTYKTLMKYERMGIVPTGSNAVGFGTSNRWRLYSEQEIQDIVERVRNHVTTHKGA